MKDRDVPAAPWPPVILADTQVRTIRAASNGAAYRISIAFPQDGAGAVPVIYALDAHMMFAGLVEAHRRASRRPESTGIHPAVIVGIDHIADDDARLLRWRDYTAGPAEDAAETIPAGSLSGGAEAFHRFLEDELKPMVSGDFAVDASRQSLCGHSLAGYFALWVLTTSPGAYKNYIALSPSIWWAEEGLGAGIARIAGHNVRVFIGVGERESEALGGDRRSRRDRIVRAQRFAEKLAPVLPAGAAAFEVFAHEDHASVPSVGAVRCLRTASTP